VHFTVSHQTLFRGDSIAHNWAIYLHEPAHTGYSDTTVPTAAAQLWNYTIDTEKSSNPASPAVVDGFVYVGSSDSNICCLNASDGSKIWSLLAGIFSPVNADSSAGSPAIASGVCVVGNGVISALGTLSNPRIHSLPATVIIAVV
jgi:hypothetical protein